jgi:hypothetical protein
MRDDMFFEEEEKVQALNPMYEISARVCMIRTQFESFVNKQQSLSLSLIVKSMFRLLTPRNGRKGEVSVD